MKGISMIGILPNTATPRTQLGFVPVAIPTVVSPRPLAMSHTKVENSYRVVKLKSGVYKSRRLHYETKGIVLFNHSG